MLRTQRKPVFFLLYPKHHGTGPGSVLCSMQNSMRNEGWLSVFYMVIFTPLILYPYFTIHSIVKNKIQLDLVHTHVQNLQVQYSKQCRIIFPYSFFSSLLFTISLYMVYCDCDSTILCERWLWKLSVYTVLLWVIHYSIFANFIFSIV